MKCDKNVSICIAEILFSIQFGSVINFLNSSGVELLVLEPGTSKISGRTSIYFHPMSGGQVKISVQVYLTIYFGQVN